MRRGAHELSVKLTLVVTLISTSIAVTPRRTTKLKNSPIYYISSPLLSRAVLHSALQYRPQNRLPVRSTSAQALPQSTSASAVNPLNPYSYGYSSLYKLPIQFVSNAKPIEIIKGMPIVYDFIRSLFTSDSGLNNFSLTPLS